MFVFLGKPRIPVRLEKLCITKDKSLYDELEIQQVIKTTKLFISTFNDLFDVDHTDALQRIKIKTDRLFLINQRKKGRPRFMYGIDYTNMRKEQLSMERKNKALVREKRSARSVGNCKCEFILL